MHVSRFRGRVDASRVYISTVDGVSRDDPEDLHPSGMDLSHAPLQDRGREARTSCRHDWASLAPAAAVWRRSWGSTLQYKGLTHLVNETNCYRLSVEMQLWKACWRWNVGLDSSVLWIFNHDEESGLQNTILETAFVVANWKKAIMPKFHLRNKSIT